MQTATNTNGLTIINFGIGSANAATIMDLLIARNPTGVLFLGKCGGLKHSTEIGHFILPIAAIRGGAKLSRQMKRIEWPLALEVGHLTTEAFERALDVALSPEARQMAKECAARAARGVEQVKQEFMREFLKATTATNTATTARV